MASLLGLGGSDVIHIVQFKFSPTTESHVVAKTCRDFVALQKTCLKDGKTYIASIKAGKDVSIEGKSGGFTHAFVVRFKSLGDRDYYIRQDPIHAGFANGLIGVEASSVVDFVDGEF
ncbi:Stress responsive A/B barrel domain protein [Taphrina deformans PYCC 5710]|uniref:Stress responsive A/B barrel domain protein n=1 Tax=Taphrina deformans (strain PYCC 5710 / ATCC 11124 / CBS 356.35 / IMI 108563 / JCM 9778 / NBRC 8474) TaxID=1097556 RepID=R4X6F0_TAPDE|nr:Stress responsive A/B barrel domain protein [Taphrina deformans PYCC 5710]|eukprot:CCG80635.1 Stress responsive A/B barrel domain protein [Taphrina deformans PYCC 5710]